MAESVDAKLLSGPSSNPPLPTFGVPKTAKIEKLLDAAVAQAGNVNPKLAGCMSCSKPFIVLPIQFIACVAPVYAWLYQWAYKIYLMLPQQAAKCIFGLALCFFGGTYVASIAAIEAFRQMGSATTMANLAVVRADLVTVGAANKLDDEELAKDADKDGVADGEALTSSELAQRKAFVVLKAVQRPSQLQDAVGGLWAAYIAVLATLKLEFARTTAFALGIVDVVKEPVVRLACPLVIAALAQAPPSMRLEPTGIKDWSKTIVESVLTLIAVTMAWYLQMIVSAFYSGLRGGRMFADGLLELLTSYNLMQKIPGLADFDPEESHLDEAIGYSVAAFGFGFQFFSGFTLPFPFNIIFLPLTLIEWFLRIQISMTNVGVH